MHIVFDVPLLECFSTSSRALSHGKVSRPHIRRNRRTLSWRRSRRLLRGIFATPFPRNSRLILTISGPHGFDDKPRYSHLRKIFRRLFVSEGFDYGNLYEWKILEYLRATQGRMILQRWMPDRKSYTRSVFGVDKACGFYGQMKTVYERRKCWRVRQQCWKPTSRTEVRVSGFCFMLPFVCNIIRFSGPKRSLTFVSLELCFEYRERISNFLTQCRLPMPSQSVL